MLSLFPRSMQCAGVMSCAVIMSALPVSALSIDQVPNPRQTNGGWVTDMADLLSQPTETQLNQMIAELEAQNGSEIAVVTVPETASSKSPKAFATELFNTWGIGKKEKNNGVLFLISKRARKVEIETGYGIEPILPNPEVKQIIDSQITPNFKQGNFDRGTLDGTSHLVKALKENTVSALPNTADPARIENTQETRSASGNLPTYPLPLILGPIGLFGMISYLFYRSTIQSVRLKPDGRSRTQRQKYSDEQTKRMPRCSECREVMHKSTPQDLSSQLTEIEQSAQKLGSVKYIGWQCNCQSSTHVRAYVWNDTAFKKCPHCKELTTTFTLEVLEEATRETTGLQKVTEDCECCDYHQEYKESISRLPDPRKASTGSMTAAGSTWVVGSGFTSGGGSGGSGGGFGGGSSGGGGAGGGW